MNSIATGEAKQNNEDPTHRSGCGCVKCGPPRRNKFTFEHDDEADEVLTFDGVKQSNNYDANDGSEGGT